MAANKSQSSKNNCVKNLIVLTFCWLCAGVTTYDENFPALAKFSIEIVAESHAHNLKVLVASTSKQQRRGLMLTPELTDDQGMLFMYPSPAKKCMWMKNTLYPLDVGFFDSDGKLINVQTMPAGSLESYCSLSPAKYALEVRADWFKEKEFTSDTVLRGVPGLW